MERGKLVSGLRNGDTDASVKDAVQAIGGGAGVGQNSTGPFLLMSGYSAANDSPARGYLYWPTTKSRYELSPLSAEEIRRRIHWLLANFGFARRLVYGMAETAGMITPFADTIDPEWDELVEENFLERASSPEIFDVSANYDFWTVQPQLNVNRWKDGDCLIVPTSPEGYDGLQLAFFEGSQITDQGRTAKMVLNSGKRNWYDYRDGVKTNRHGKRVKFNVQDGVDPDKYFEIPGADSFYYANLEGHHRARGLSILASVVVNMIDVVETRGFTKKRLKEDVNVGKVIETDAPQVFSGGGGMGGQIVQAAVPMPDGTTQVVDWQVASGGGEIPSLAPGQKVRVVADNRPTPDARAFEDVLLEDCSHAANFPHRGLFRPEDLKGPGSRYVIGQIRRWASNQFRYQARFVRWYRALHISNEIEAGRLPRPREIKGKPLWWLKSAYVGQADLSIDEGRKGNLALVNLESGLTTWGKEWGELGHFWKHPIRQRVKEMSFAKAECTRENLSPIEVFPKLFSVSSGTPLAAPGDEPKAA